MFLLVVNIVLLVAGAFMEPSAIILILAPILFPIAVQLGIDPIHLGIIMVVNMEIGLITPPVGLNLFVASAVTGMPVTQVIRAVLPWLALMLSFLVIITYVPSISWPCRTGWACSTAFLLSARPSRRAFRRENLGRGSDRQRVGRATTEPAGQ